MFNPDPLPFELLSDDDKAERSVARAAHKSRSLGPHASRTAPRDWWDLIREALEYFGVADKRSASRAETCQN
jgi:hypothetical protein